LEGAGLRLREDLTKDEAHDEALRRWRELPPEERQSPEQAQIFAAGLADTLDFRTMGNERKVIAAWLIRDLAASRIGPARPLAGDVIGPRAEPTSG
jgi:hypothetical protein